MHQFWPSVTRGWEGGRRVGWKAGRVGVGREEENPQVKTQGHQSPSDGSDQSPSDGSDHSTRPKGHHSSQG